MSNNPHQTAWIVIFETSGGVQRIFHYPHRWGLSQVEQAADEQVHKFAGEGEWFITITQTHLNKTVDTCLGAT